MQKIAGDPPLRRHPPGFEGLARIIIGQQLSTASATAIFDRVCLACGKLTAESFVATQVTELKAAGLSRAKITTLSGVAEAIMAGRLSLSRPTTKKAEAFRENLLNQKGIGPWTVDIYEMFCLGRADAFAPGDMALQEAARRAFRSSKRPSPSDLLEIAEVWRPQRGVAARMLWTYYATGHGKTAAIEQHAT